MGWSEAQEWEKKWHGNCSNDLGEELKQLVYAVKMGLVFTPTDQTPYSIDLKGKSVIDIGGGPNSLLLKTRNESDRTVADPLDVPGWVIERYRESRIKYLPTKAEDLKIAGYDEAWIYNCLQHTDNPEQVIRNARAGAKLIRIFEWIDTEPNIGHPNKLTEEDLNRWLGGEGKVEIFTTENNLKGTVSFSNLRIPIFRGQARMYYGIFKGQT